MVEGEEREVKSRNPDCLGMHCTPSALFEVEQSAQNDVSYFLASSMLLHTTRHLQQSERRPNLYTFTVHCI